LEWKRLVFGVRVVVVDVDGGKVGPVKEEGGVDGREGGEGEGRQWKWR
jgi:hypothetical protein